MSNIDALIAEVKSDLSKYADVGLLDEISMYRDAVQGVKKFGNDVAELHETVVKVEEGYADLPLNFRTLYAAYLCNPEGFSVTGDVEYHDLQSSHFYIERTTRGTTWNECNGCCDNVTENVIKENLYFKTNKAAEFYYSQPILLSLGKTFNRNNCHSKCRNKYVKDNPNEIVIIKNTLQANFSEGHIYMMYYGLPMDEEGNIDFPDTKNGNLEEYLEYRLKRKAAERLIGNKDAEGLTNMYPVYRREERMYLREASNELKMTRLSPRSMKRWQRLNTLESLRYESGLTQKF